MKLKYFTHPRDNYKTAEIEVTKEQAKEAIYFYGSTYLTVGDKEYRLAHFWEEVMRMANDEAPTTK